jgi:uncharacterized protein (DUF2147 family)
LPGDAKAMVPMRRLRYRTMRVKFVTIIVASLAVAFASAGPLRAAEPSVVGLWEQADDRGHSWFLFFEQDGVYQGAIAKMFFKPGESPNPICSSCVGDQKNAPVFGLVIVKGMRRNGLAYDKGTVLDPRNGSIYQAKMKLSPDGQRLTLRGFLGIDLFGQDQVWKRLPDDALLPNEVPPNLLQHWAAVPAQPDKKLPNSGGAPKNGGAKNIQPSRQ